MHILRSRKDSTQTQRYWWDFNVDSPLVPCSRSKEMRGNWLCVCGEGNLLLSDCGVRLFAPDHCEITRGSHDFRGLLFRSLRLLRVSKQRRIM